MKLKVCYLPVNGNVVTSSVDDFDDQGIPVPRLDGGARELAVDSYYVVSSA